jgi:sirohydrochlorin ferrochelatase
VSVATPPHARLLAPEAVPDVVLVPLTSQTCCAAAGDIPAMLSAIAEHVSKTDLCTMILLPVGLVPLSSSRTGKKVSEAVVSALTIVSAS